MCVDCHVQWSLVIHFLCSQPALGFGTVNRYGGGLQFSLPRRNLISPVSPPTQYYSCDPLNFNGKHNICTLTLIPICACVSN